MCVYNSLGCKTMNFLTHSLLILILSNACFLFILYEKNLNITLVSSCTHEEFFSINHAELESFLTSECHERSINPLKILNVTLGFWCYELNILLISWKKKILFSIPYHKFTQWRIRKSQFKIIHKWKTIKFTGSDKKSSKCLAQTSN